MNKPVLHFIAGPTAVGKTALAIEWALENDAEIVSCDSLLVYKGMDIGTAKPSKKEMDAVPHHLIDCAEVNAVFSVKDYMDMARAAVEDIVGRGKQVLVAGGSGFYLKSYFRPVIDDVPVLPPTELAVMNIYEASGLPGLLELLNALNPEGLGDLDIQNPRRVMKALLRCMASGLTLKELKERFDALPIPFEGFDKRVCYLTRSRESLHDRALQRARLMIEAGLIDEVRALRNAGIEDNPSARTAIGYREVLAWLEDETSLDDLIAIIAKNTNTLIRKQATWFKKQIHADQVIDMDLDYEISNVLKA